MAEQDASLTPLPTWAREAVIAAIDDAVLAVCETMLLQGAHSYQIDEALVEGGWKIGPYERQDHVGLGPAYARRRANGGAHDGVDMIISNRMVEEGRLGKIVGVGWYRYPGGGGAVIDPITEDLIVEESRFACVERRDFSDMEILETVNARLEQTLHELATKGVMPLAMPKDPDEFVPPDLRKKISGPDHLVANGLLHIEIETLREMVWSTI